MSDGEKIVLDGEKTAPDSEKLASYVEKTRLNGGIFMSDGETPNMSMVYSIC